MKNRTVIVYGNYFEDFLAKQSQKEQIKILQVLRLIEEMDIIPSNYLKHIEGTDGLFEIRTAFGGNTFRVFCFFDEGNLVVLLTGFQKKTMKLPATEIKRALRIRQNYYNEKASEKI